jgi:nitroreductase
MNKTIKELIEQRVSTNHFDPRRTLSDHEIGELVRLATRAPSAFNFQNWKFVAVKTPEAKERLKAVAYGQQKVVDAAVTFIVCGTLTPHRELAEALRPSLDQGILEPALVDGWVSMATGMYEGNAAFLRDEAIRSASLAAMTLMLAAEGMGLASGPMIGFDPAGVAREFGLGANDLPAILVAIGHAAPGNWPQKPRRDLAQVLAFA